jgi:hypothetical protein
MRGFWLGLSLSVAFVLGCATARLVVPPANAQATARWEHLCVEAGTLERATAKSNEVGAQGWEMSGAVNYEDRHMVLCFKRPR